MHPDRLLLVDDDSSLLRLLSIRLETEGFEVHVAQSAEEALQLLRNQPVEVVVTDLRMEGASGLELFEQIRHFHPGLPVIIMSAQGTIPEAVAATQMGVFEFLTKPIDKVALQLLRNQPVEVVVTDLRMEGASGLELFEQIRHFHPGLPVIIMSAQGTIPEAVAATQMGVFEFLTKPIDKVALLTTIRSALQQSGSTSTDLFEAWREHIVTRSPAMERILNQVRQVASSDISILITGESGTGKELLARAVHEAGNRSDGPMVAINCGALPEQLLESELFGHVKGAFTGAISDHGGLFRAANGGTLLLDEIGDMPPPLQVKLLRALQERRIRSIGATATDSIDVRIISATNRDLEKDMSEGLFREDLFYRLNVVNFHLPSLAERVEDIPLLANHFLRGTGAFQMGSVTSFAPGAMEVLINAPWPGNVRQLENVVQRTAALSTAPVIHEALVREALTVEDQYLPSLTQAREQFEHDYLVKVMRLTDGAVAAAASLAQRNRTDFYKLLKRHNIVPESFKND